MFEISGKRLIDACWLILQPYLKKHIDMIENIQRKATKLIPGLSDFSASLLKQQFPCGNIASLGRIYLV
jgi:hypothetical protein